MFFDICPSAVDYVGYLIAKVLTMQVSKTHMGGTMRLGARKTLLQTADCITAKLYAELLQCSCFFYCFLIFLLPSSQEHGNMFS